MAGPGRDLEGVWGPFVDGGEQFGATGVADFAGKCCFSDVETGW